MDACVGAVVCPKPGCVDDDSLETLRRATDLCGDDVRLAVLGRVVERAGEIRRVLSGAGLRFPVGPALEGAIFIECAQELGVEPLELWSLLEGVADREATLVDRLLRAVSERRLDAAGASAGAA